MVNSRNVSSSTQSHRFADKGGRHNLFRRGKGMSRKLVRRRVRQRLPEIDETIAMMGFLLTAMDGGGKLGRCGRDPKSKADGPKTNLQNWTSVDHVIAVDPQPLALVQIVATGWAGDLFQRKRGCLSGCVMSNFATISGPIPCWPCQTRAE